MPSSHLTLCRPLLLLPPIPPTSESFPMSQLFTWGGQSIGVSASASVFPMNIQDWFSLGWTGWISSQSKGLSRVFSNTTVLKHQFFGTQLSSQRVEINKSAVVKSFYYLWYFNINSKVDPILGLLYLIFNLTWATTSSLVLVHLLQKDKWQN